MKHYEKLLELGCFSKNDLEQIAGSEAAAKWLCREYQKKGYIERVKRDLYVAISLETQQPIANRYVIASHISNDAAVSYHSAFEFYGYSNQVFYETQVTSESRFRDFEYDGVTYRRIAPRITGGITEINGIRVTTLERTVIDSINLFEKIGGLEELLRCLALIPTLDEAAIKTLVVQDKWLATLQAGIKAEIERITQQLASRVKELEERYAEPLLALEASVEALSEKVAEHLRAMGLEW